MCVQVVRRKMQRRIAVVGAGAVGLSTAVQIQQMHPSASLTLIADKFTTETTSSGAAGIFRPSTGKFPEMPVQKLKLVLRRLCFRCSYSFSLFVLVVVW